MTALLSGLHGGALCRARCRHEARGVGRLVKAGRRPPEGLGLDEANDAADAAGGLAGRALPASKPDGLMQLVRLMHRDPRSGRDERSSQCSDELLSVQGVQALHLMLRAREAHWQTPVTDAPLLLDRSLLRSDPRTLRARRPLIMMMRSLATVRWNKAARDFRQWPA